MTTGRYTGLPAGQYHGSEGLGSTAVKTVADLSVAHWLAYRQQAASPAMRLGSMHHCAILEPGKFEAEYVVAPRQKCPKCPSGRKSMPGAVHCHQHGGKTESSDWLDAIGTDVEVITAEEKAQALETAEGVRASVQRSALPGLLEAGDREVSYYARAILTSDGYQVTTEGDEGIMVKGRVDIDYPGLCVDLKGVGRVDLLQPRKWSWRIHDFGLHIQAALYIDLVEAVTGTRPLWGWLVHQTTAPYATRLFTADEADIDDGRAAVAEALYRWQEYQETGNAWVGWPTDRETVSMPGFLREEI